MEKMVEYVWRELDNPNNILILLMEQGDPRVDFAINNMPKDLTYE